MQSIESLNTSLSALKSLLSDYALRSTQAETMAGRLMVDKLSPEQFREVLGLLREQVAVRSKERAVHQQALIQATIITSYLRVNTVAGHLKPPKQNTPSSRTLPHLASVYRLDP